MIYLEMFAMKMLDNTQSDQCAAPNLTDCGNMSEIVSLLGQKSVLFRCQFSYRRGIIRASGLVESGGTRHF